MGAPQRAVLAAGSNASEEPLPILEQKRRKAIDEASGGNGTKRRVPLLTSLVRGMRDVQLMFVQLYDEMPSVEGDDLFAALDSTWKPSMSDHVVEMRDRLHEASSYRCHHLPFNWRARKLGFERQEHERMTTGGERSFDLVHKVESNLVTLELDMLTTLKRRAPPERSELGKAAQNGKTAKGEGGAGSRDRQSRDAELDTRGLFNSVNDTSEVEINSEMVRSAWPRDASGTRGWAADVWPHEQRVAERSTAHPSTAAWRSANAPP